MKSSVIAASLFATSAIADVCNRDNVLRCLVSSSVVASPFCSSYLSIPVVTVTVSTFTPVTTTTTTAITTVTTDTTSTASATATVGFAKRAVDVVWVNGVAFHAGSVPSITARDVAPSTSPAPKCLTQVSSSSYPASRISSACSCLGVSTSTTSVTATAPTATSTLVSSTTESTTLVTVTTTTAIAMETCDTTFSVPGAFTYKRYYKGSGFTENYNNPGNNVPQYPPRTTTYPGTSSACDVLQQCASFAAFTGGVFNPGTTYYQFDLHYLTSQSVYECVAFYNGNNNPSYFNVANEDVFSGVGYSRT